MNTLRANWFPFCFIAIILLVILNDNFSFRSAFSTPYKRHIRPFFYEDSMWQPPSEVLGPDNEKNSLVMYGQSLIANTAYYLGPKGKVKAISNGMNCQNCHMDAGKRNFGNCFSAVSSTYPKYRDRSGKLESIEFRINECMERSLNGEPLDSNSREMRAMIAYFNWLGSEVPKGITPRGAGLERLPYLDRAADTTKGRIAYTSKCVRCHGSNGEGQMNYDSSYYLYPPLWGPHSYTVSAGMYRLTRLAGFIRNNMPYGADYNNPQLSTEEAWDIAAYISSQPRPAKMFSYDWPDLSRKPVDYPFGPYTDEFSEARHKYGPFKGIAKRK